MATNSSFDDTLHDDDLQSREQPDLETTLQALRESEAGHMSATLYYGLANLDEARIGYVKPVWGDVPSDRRVEIVRQMIDLSEVNVDLDYRLMGYLGLDDDDPAVREAAIELLWEDQSLALMNKLMEMAQWDEAVPVRAAAAGALGRFILSGELGDLPETETIEAQEVVASLYNDNQEDVEVRRRALEAIANCGHEMVEDAINEAYHSADERMRASAVYAMGCTCDERWNDIVIREIGSPDPAMRYEAARASGQLELREAIPHLARLVHETDVEIKQAAIWSLGEIGGRQAVRVLSSLAEEAEQAKDDDLLELIEEAIGSASLIGEDLDFDFEDER